MDMQPKHSLCICMHPFVYHKWACFDGIYIDMKFTVGNFMIIS